MVVTRTDKLVVSRRHAPEDTRITAPRVDVPWTTSTLVSGRCTGETQHQSGTPAPAEDGKGPFLTGVSMVF